MALKRNETYPGRFSNPSTSHPQGAFKNRTSPTAQDGSYLEASWANDWDGFFARLLTLAGATANGVEDSGTSSQYFDALVVAMKANLGTAAVKNIGNASGQVPDMSFFTKGTNWFKLPSGKIVQHFQVSSLSTGVLTASYPIPFPSVVNSVYCSPVDTVSPNWAAANVSTLSSCLISAWDRNNVRAATRINVYAIGE
ncbi:TPA: hypothetical protein SIF59_004050 [Escherichia coli]|nr:hypothetical protein [Escherichia coli]HEI0663063.1 hypothetical protein [Escherichia coli]